MRKIIFVIMVCVLLCSSDNQAHSQEMDVLNSYSSTFGDKTIQNISVVANADILDCTECSQEIIQHCIANDFHTIQFSYDVHGYPVEVNARVYETEEDYKRGICLFEMSYVQDNNTYEYNIVDNPEHFTMNIKTK